ncbi:MAG TPA: hypothetical protein VLX09_02575 [Stellaceae bacterium]|nr:hypothetical protein [Stellaceae bacterium]
MTFTQQVIHTLINLMLFAFAYLGIGWFLAMLWERITGRRAKESKVTRVVIGIGAGLIWLALIAAHTYD